MVNQGTKERTSGSCSETRRSSHSSHADDGSKSSGKHHRSSRHGDSKKETSEHRRSRRPSAEEELTALKIAVEGLEIGSLKAEQRISELENLEPQQANGGTAKGATSEDDELVEIDGNSYTMLYTSPVCSLPFVVGVVPCLIQFSVFSLFLLDLLNTAKVPPGVATLVRACQIIAIFITFLVDTDMLRGIRALIYREGFDDIANEFEGFASWKFYISNVLMAIQGLLGTVVAFFLIIFADNVFDLLLNFTAIMFVSELDEVLFFFVKTGYAGVESEKLAKKIESTMVKQSYPNGLLRYLHLILFGLAMILVFVAFSAIAMYQDSQESLASMVKVEFGDDVDPTLGLFSGCYAKQLNNGWDARVRYVQTQSDRGQGDFEYCIEDSLQTWVFSTSQSESACDEGNFVLRSAEERSTSFDLLDAKSDQWLLETGNPISVFQLGEIDRSRFMTECGKISIQGSASNEELCPVLTIDPNAIGFSGSHDWSRTFVFLTNAKNETVQFYQRPVFVGESKGIEGYELLFFAGRRWVLASAAKLLTDGGRDPSNKVDVVSLFERSDFWLLELPMDSLAFLSEAVSQGNDRGTPLGLQWYNTRHPEDIKFPFADIGRPVDATFRCGKCNSRNNPCLYDGVCEDDGVCTCRHGASGKLCEIKPLRDGVCNPFFNTEPDGYDGGDCCVVTCSNANCGIGSMEFAFDQSLRRRGIGFPNCTDPSMVPITIALEVNEANYLWNGDFESYTIEVSCEGGEKVPLRVALDPRRTGTLSETVYLSDTSGSCLLSFIGIQSYTSFNCAFELYDGSESNADSMLLMKEEKNIGADAKFEFPAAYSRCLKSTLAGTIDEKHFYTGTYQDEAFGWLSNDVSKSGECSLNEAEYLTERYALLALSKAEEAPEGSESWVSSRDHCLWPRVTCDGSKVVDIAYDGETNGPLKGLWAPEVALLRHLERIELFGNEFLEGSIPTGIFDLGALTFLKLHDNGLTGSLPSEIGNLKSTNLILHRNRLTGTIPSEVGDLGGLKFMHLNNNDLSGTIPSDVGRMHAVLQFIFHTNALSGTIPSEVGDMGALQYFYLNENSLNGTIPSEVGNMSSVRSLRLESNSLTGTIPSEVGNLSFMRSMRLSFNRLTGTIPSEVWNLSSLSTLDLRNNRLTGSLPSEIGLLKNLRKLLLGGSMFSGVLPTEILQLTKLEELDLSGNLFSEEEVHNITKTLGF